MVERTKIKIGLYIVKSEKKMQPSTFHAFIYIQNSSALFCNLLFQIREAVHRIEDGHNEENAYKMFKHNIVETRSHFNVDN